MSQFYLEIGTAIITVVIVDMLLLSRKGEEKAQMDRIEKKLDELLERKKD